MSNVRSVRRTIHKFVRRTSIGQGMTEYIIIVALIAIAAIGVFTAFGNTAKNQVGAMALELSGQDGTQQVNAAKNRAGEGKAFATTNTGLSNYGNQSKNAQ